VSLNAGVAATFPERFPAESTPNTAVRFPALRGKNRCDVVIFRTLRSRAAGVSSSLAIPPTVSMAVR